MRYRKPRYAILLLICLSVTLTGCQTQGVKDTQPITTPKREWATFSGRLSRERNVNNFPSRFYVRTMNGRRLKGAVKNKRIDCLMGECKLHPGRHSIEVDYYWSTSHTRKERNRKEFWEALSVVGALYGGDLSFSSRQDNLCQITLAFEVQAARE